MQVGKHIACLLFEEMRCCLFLSVILSLLSGRVTAYYPRATSAGARPAKTDRPMQSEAKTQLGPLKSKVKTIGETKGKGAKQAFPLPPQEPKKGNAESVSLPLSLSSGMEKMGESSSLWRICVVFLCILWSTNFPVIVQIFNAVPGLTPQVYAAIRFTIAASVLSPSYIGLLKDVELIKSTFIIGACLFLGFIGQSIGLSFPHASANKSAFLCSCIVVWVTFLKAFLVDYMPLSEEFKEKNAGGNGVSPTALASVALSVMGIGVLELQSDMEPSWADLWFCLQPIGFGTGYLLIEDMMKQKKYKKKSAAISGLRIFFVTIFSYIWCFLSGSQISEFADVIASPTAMKYLAYTGIITTGMGVYLQTQAFKRVSATDASLILSTEPLFTAVFSASLIQEPIGASVVTGGILIILACLVNEVESDWGDLTRIKDEIVAKIDKKGLSV